MTIDCHRLPRTCHRLPKPAMTCHGLSAFSRHARRSACCRGRNARCPRHSMSRRGLKLWHIDIPRRGEMRVCCRHENEGEGHRGPVTGCHIENDALKRETCAARGLARPFRAFRSVSWFVPRALPWAAMVRTFGAQSGRPAVGRFGGVGDYCYQDLFWFELRMFLGTYTAACLLLSFAGTPCRRR